MAEKEWEKGAPVGGIVLLILGVVLLLQTTGYVSWQLWDKLWRLWPVLIIVAGINLLFRRVSPWLVSILVIAILVGCILYAYYQAGPAALGTVSIFSIILTSFIHG